MREGRFNEPPADLARRFSASVSFDQHLAHYDIAGSRAHANALAAAGIITADEACKIDNGLSEIEKDIAAGKFEWEAALEDVHMNIEAALTRKIGEAGAKLHTARSRNDQVALDLRLYVKDHLEQISTRLQQLQRAFVQLADEHVDLVMPGYTHLQRAQPIYFAHYLLGQIEIFARDVDRLRDCRKRTDVLPLGSGALAGSTIALDRQLLARELGFARVSENSMDAVSDRDFIAEFLFGIAMIGMHLSRLSEDFILWSTSEFGFIEFSDAFSTGSSLMPQKKNPDMAELTRGKTGRLYGNLMSILTTLKGLPSTYNRDLQEDKEALFDSVDTIEVTLELWVAMLPEIKMNRERMEAAARDPALFATDLAEHLVKQGTPFREAHRIVGERAAKNLPLDQLSPEKEIFDARRSLGKRTAAGAPSPQNIAARLKHWKNELK
ncbi:MAG: argininosuccinate lyase [Verrucomicrobiota bacterium]|jgi:argininosuccinate lyase